MMKLLDHLEPFKPRSNRTITVLQNQELNGADLFSTQKSVCVGPSPQQVLVIEPFNGLEPVVLVLMTKLCWAECCGFMLLWNNHCQKTKDAMFIRQSAPSLDQTSRSRSADLQDLKNCSRTFR